MKKQILTLFVISVLSTGFVSAQCTPDTTIKEPGYHPEVFDEAVVDQDYKQELQIRVIKDTQVVYNGFPVTAQIDSINLLEIMGLPSSFDYVCYNPTCSYIPSETGCAVLTGKPTSQDVGTHPLELVVKVYARVFSVVLSENDTIRDQFALTVSRTGSSKIVRLNEDAQFYPNPSVSGVFELDNHQWLGSSIEVYNSQGKLCQKSSLSSPQLDLSSLPAGLYTYVITNKNDHKSVGRLMSVRH